MLHPLRLSPALVFAAALACQQAPSQPTPGPAEPAAKPETEAAPPSGGPKDASGGPWKHEFKDPPAGRRAPSYDAFRVKLGTTRFDDVGELVAALGLDCGDTSIRAMMDRRREKEKKRQDEAKARGEDAVTSASWMNRRSKRESNPQVRFSCPKITSDQIGDRPRVASTGRLLYVFDAYEYPVRHSSYQRTHQDHALAIKDFQDTVAVLTKTYGEPTKPLKNELPVADKTGAVEVPSAVNYEVAWEYADLLVRTNLLRYGKLVTVGERVEVPHGLRPDAPNVGQTGASSAPTDKAAKPELPTTSSP